MTCSFPPELDDKELLAYVWGDGDERCKSHVARCAHCRDKAAALARAEGRLTGILYRYACPSAHALGEYHLGVLPAERARAVAAHLAECPHCTAEVAQLTRYLEELRPDIELSALRRIRTVIAELVSGARRAASPGWPSLAPAYAGLRGGQEAGPSIYRAEEMQIALDVQDDQAHPGCVVLLGLVAGAVLPGMQVRLEREDAVVASAAVDDLGNFALAGLARGDYRLVLAGGEVEIRIPSVGI